MRLKEFVFIVEGYQEAEQEFAKSADINQVKKLIDAYRSLVDRNQVQGPERNIDHWRRQGWDTFSQFVQSKSQERSKTQVKRGQGITTQQITLRDDNAWLIVIPLDRDTSCFHGRGTDWCTAKTSQRHFDNYFYNRNVILIYCINQQTGDKWAIAAHAELYDRGEFFEYFDKKDNRITKDDFDYQTGLNSTRIIQQAFDQSNISTIDNAKKSYIDAITRLKKLQHLTNFAQVSPEQKPEIERLLLFVKDPDMTLKYLRNNGIKRWPAGEPIIASDPIVSYNYAKDIIQGRFPAGEPAIASDKMAAYHYAKDIIQGRFPKGEPAIAKDPYLAFKYAQNVIQGRWPEAEPAIAKDPYLALLALEYAHDVIKGRWPEAEPAIAKNSAAAYHYAKDIIQGRWPKGEPAIAKDPYLAFKYAQNVIQGRFPKGEPAIAKNPKLAFKYAQNVIQGRWTEAGIQ